MQTTTTSEVCVCCGNFADDSRSKTTYSGNCVGEGALLFPKDSCRWLGLQQPQAAIKNKTRERCRKGKKYAVRSSRNPSTKANAPCTCCRVNTAYLTEGEKESAGPNENVKKKMRQATPSQQNEKL